MSIPSEKLTNQILCMENYNYKHVYTVEKLKEPLLYIKVEREKYLQSLFVIERFYSCIVMVIVENGFNCIIEALKKFEPDTPRAYFKRNLRNSDIILNF